MYRSNLRLHYVPWLNGSWIESQTSWNDKTIFDSSIEWRSNSCSWMLHNVIHGYYAGDRYSYPCSRGPQKFVLLLRLYRSLRNALQLSRIPCTFLSRVDVGDSVSSDAHSRVDRKFCADSLRYRCLKSITPSYICITNRMWYRVHAVSSIVISDQRDTWV